MHLVISSVQSFNIPKIEYATIFVSVSIINAYFCCCCFDLFVYFDISDVHREENKKEFYLKTSTEEGSKLHAKKMSSDLTIN